MDHQAEYQDPREFSEFLDSQRGERGISARLSERPRILYWALSRAGGHDRYVFREFPLGSRFVADFVVLNSYSGTWKVTFVELEPVDCKPFTKAGVPSARLAGAIKQIDDWADYFASNREQVRSDLVRWAKGKDILGYSDRNDPCNFSGNYLADPSTRLWDDYMIFVGRRSMLDGEGHRRKTGFASRHSVEIASYDRLLDLVSERYGNAAHWGHGSWE